MLKAYRYRIYPNKEQEIQLAKDILAAAVLCIIKPLRTETMLMKKKKSLSVKQVVIIIAIESWKKVYEWLKEVDKFALTNAIYNMDSAYQKFFKEHAGYPKFKSKHDNHKSYTTNFTNGNITVDFDRRRIKLPKLKRVKIKLHRKFLGQIKTATISKVPSGKYYVSILVETEHSPLVKQTDK